MSGKERRRLEVFSQVQQGKLLVVKAAELLGLSYRQAKRCYARYQAEGDAGLVHRLRGRSSNRGVDQAKKTRVLTLYREKYHDFGPTLACEYLDSEDGEKVGVETLRQWLKQAGLWSARRKRAQHRKWRERKAHPGELVQLDGSHHDWFEGRRDWAVLMVLIDDATNRCYARFFEEETTAASFETFWRYTQRYGLPHAVYPDKAAIYRTTRDATVDENLAAEPAQTQFGRAMQELDVKLTLANSPQAKGRVERRNGVFQDRLVKALRLKQLSDLESANTFLEEEYLEELNRRFTVPAKNSVDLHRRVPRSVKLERVLSFQEERVVQSDWTIRWRNRWFQLTEANQKLALVKQRVTVCEQLDGEIVILYRGRDLAWDELPDRPGPQRAAKPPVKSSVPRKKPGPDHPFRRPFKTPVAPRQSSVVRKTGK